jgi:hypothetical protein
VPVRPALALSVLLVACDGVPELVDPRAELARPLVAVPLELVGVPMAGLAPYARNAWDLKVYADRLYVGGGNSSNWGPSPNAGPIPVVSWDGRSLAREFWTSEEQVDRFVEVDGALVVPGHDPRDDWSLGNFYRLEAAGWVKHRTIPGGIHAYDVAGHGGLLYAALGSVDPRATVVRSADGGLSWVAVPLDAGWRAVSLVPLGPELHASTYAGTWRVDGAAAERDADGAWTDDRADSPVVLQRAVTFHGRAVYVSAAVVNDHQWRPLSLRWRAAGGPSHLVDLPGGALPRDLVVDGERLLVLAHAPGDVGDAVVLETVDVRHFREVLRARLPALARSLESYRGDLYLGLGCEADDVREESGWLLRESTRGGR